MVYDIGTSVKKAIWYLVFLVRCLPLLSGEGKILVCIIEISEDRDGKAGGHDDRNDEVAMCDKVGQIKNSFKGEILYTGMWLIAWLGTVCSQDQNTTRRGSRDWRSETSSVERRYDRDGACRPEKTRVGGMIGELDARRPNFSVSETRSYPLVTP